MEWGCRHVKMTEVDWSKVIWSDEAYLCLGDAKGSVYVTRRDDEVLNDDCVVQTFKQSSVRIMIWGCIMEDSKGPLVVLEYPGGKGGGMNAARYQDQVLSGPFIQ